MLKHTSGLEYLPSGGCQSLSAEKLSSPQSSDMLAMTQLFWIKKNLIFM